MDIFICDRSIFCQFDFRTVEDAGPYNAWKDSFSFLRTYCEVAFLWPFLLLKNKVPTNRFIGLWELFLQKWCLRKGFNAFSLAQQAQRKSFAKRKRRKGEFRSLRRATKGSAFGNRKPLKRLDLNFKTGEKMKLVDLPADIVFGWSLHPSVNKTRVRGAGTACLRVMTSSFVE